jgi:pimeloyl-ACP methyl ester carboxylesterase
MICYERKSCTMSFLKKVLMTGFMVIIFVSSLPSASALEQETISRRDLVIDLGDGLTTAAQLTFPAVGDGPFPGVLLIPGGGTPDMDEYMPAEATETGEPATPFLQIAEYLSERGFAVLRFNKRGIGFGSTLLNPAVFFNTTIQDLIQDAEKALEVLMQQSEVNADCLTLLGHSESTIIAPIIAVKDSSVKNIVLMGAAARSFSEIRYFKMVDLRISLAEDVLDSDHNGLISILEILEGLGPGPKAAISANDLIENSTGEWLFRPPWDTNGDGYMSISEEFQPLLIRLFEYMIAAEYPGSKLVQSHLTLNATLDLIADVPSSILILQGENDILTPFEEALLLEQRLTETAHPDHTLITYPGLGHYFYPEDYWNIAMGPMQDYVLSNLAMWLKDPARNIRDLHAQLQAAENTIEDLQAQLHLQISESEGRNDELRSALGSSTNLAYTAIGIATIAVAAVVAMIVKERTRKNTGINESSDPN